MPADLAAPIFFLTVQRYVDLTVLAAVIVVELWALFSCLRQRQDAFPLVGSLSKTAWVAILGGATLLTVLTGICRLTDKQSGGAISLFAFAGVTVALLYLLDLRPALRDAQE